MSNGLFVAGTDTEVGKTYVTCRLLERLRAKGVHAVGMKPVASGMKLAGSTMVNDDVEQILSASGHGVPRELLNQYSFEQFIAPHLAAEQLGQRIELETVTKAFQELAQHADLVIMEGAGGLMTPLNDDATYLDLVQQLTLDVVLVVAIRLGCINHALLTQHVLQKSGVSLVGWVANYTTPGAARDKGIEKSLQSRLDAPLLGVMPWQGISEHLETDNLFN